MEALPPTPSSLPSPPTLEGRLRSLGQELGEALTAVLAALPGAPHRPGRLAEELGVNRAVASRLLNATSARDPLEVLHLMPGLDPLRRVVRTAQEKGLADTAAARAEQAISAFDQAIREEAGTRPALDAIIAARLPGARERLETSSKYSVFKGLTQLKGVQGELWLGAAIVAPSATDPEKHDLTWLNGAVAMQRLRPGVTVRFSYRHRAEGAGVDDPGDTLPSLGVLPLDAFCVHTPARLEARAVGDTIQYTLPDDLLGPREAVDMFVVDHHPAALRRHARHPGNRTSFFLEPAIPVARLVFDTFVHRDSFTGSDPELILYDTGYDGIADVNDRSRDIDRVDVRESLQFLGHGSGAVEIEGIPTYAPMLRHLADRFGWNLDDFRAFRTSIAYPVYGWQVCMAFEQPPQLP